MWLSVLVHNKMHTDFALKTIHSLQRILKTVNQSETNRQGTLHNICKRVHEHFIQWLDMNALSLCEDDDSMPYHEVPDHISLISDLVQSHNVSEI